MVPARPVPRAQAPFVAERPGSPSTGSARPKPASSYPTSAPPPPANPASPPRSLAPPGNIARLSPALLPVPGDDRAGFHPWLTLTAVAAAATRSQPGGVHKARGDGPEQVRSTLAAACPPRRTHWRATRMLARARPARCRIGPDRRDHAQAVCCPNSPPSPHFNAHADHSRHQPHPIWQSTRAPAAGGQYSGVPVCGRVPPESAD